MSFKIVENGKGNAKGRGATYRRAVLDVFATTAALGARLEADDARVGHGEQGGWSGGGRE